MPFEQWLGETSPSARPDRDGTEMICGRYRLDCSRMHPLMTELPEIVHLPSRVGTHLELRAAIDLLAGELDEARPGSCVALPNLLDLLLVYMIRAWMTETTSGAWPGVLGDSVTAAALRAMHSHPAAPWSIDRLAAEAGVSRPTLARRFTTLVGRPPMAYLTWWRVILAAALLRDTKETLAAIADRVGYGSPYALSHAFQREFGTTPGRYREAANRRATSDASPR
ncbi:AraC family transcriptional regulator [Nonomuraea wenchangensis]